MSEAASARTDRSLPLVLLVAALASLGALLGPVALQLGGHLPPPCARPALRGVELSCGGTAKGPVQPLGARAWLVGQRLDVNRASANELAKVPGIGRKLASAIVKERRERGGFRTLDEIDDVRGVGPAKLKRLRRFVEVPVSESRPASGGR